MQTVTTLDQLLPLVTGVDKLRDFCWIIIQVVPAKLKNPLGRQARDALGREWTDKALQGWLSPGRHTEAYAETKRQASAAHYAVAENKKRNRENTTIWKAFPKNKERQRKAQVNYCQKRRAKDSAFRTANLLRTRLYKVVKAGGAGKSASTMELTDCTLPELMAHLEAQFTEGMTWANQGEWHIDHIRPCASFDLTDPEQQRQCFHWTNLAPLWAADNMSKGDRLDWSPSAQVEPQVGPTASNI